MGKNRKKKGGKWGNLIKLLSPCRVGGGRRHLGWSVALG